MIREKREYTIVCDRCGSTLKNWEDKMSHGHMEIDHSSVIDTVFGQDFKYNSAVKMGKHPYQSMVLDYGKDNAYHLCWSCNRELIENLGKFFTMRCMYRND